MVQDLEMLVERIQRLIRECYPPDPVQELLFKDTGSSPMDDGSHPGPGYVNQD